MEFVSQNNFDASLMFYCHSSTKTNIYTKLVSNPDLPQTSVNQSETWVD